jgi:anamorsin
VLSLVYLETDRILCPATSHRQTISIARRATGRINAGETTTSECQYSPPAPPHERNASTAMSPSIVTIDTSDDFVVPLPAKKQPQQQQQNGSRTLLLAPPSIASHEEKLRQVLAAHDRAVTDLQMLDRLSAGFVSLPEATYDLILVLTDADGSRAESTALLGRDVFGRIVPALRVGGRLQAQDGSLGQASGGADAREAVLAGLVAAANGFTKVEEEEEAVPIKLSFGKKKKAAAADEEVKPMTVAPPVANPPAGVGFVDFSDDFNVDEDDDDLIDEDTLLTEDDLNRPLAIRKCLPSWMESKAFLSQNSNTD